MYCHTSSTTTLCHTRSTLYNCTPAGCSSTRSTHRCILVSSYIHSGLWSYYFMTYDQWLTCDLWPLTVTYDVCGIWYLWYVKQYKCTSMCNIPNTKYLYRVPNYIYLLCIMRQFLDSPDVTPKRPLESCMLVLEGDHQISEHCALRCESTEYLYMVQA